jgi:hypothetical protein
MRAEERRKIAETFMQEHGLEAKTVTVEDGGRSASYAIGWSAEEGVFTPSWPNMEGALDWVFANRKTLAVRANDRLAPRPGV